MKKFNAFIEKRNFKKIFIVYVIAAVICGAVCAGAVGYIFKEKISLAVEYKKADDAFEKQSSYEELKKDADRLAGASGDICGVLLADNKNKVIYAAKTSDFAAGEDFELKRAESGKLLQSKKNPDMIFRFVKKDEFMLSAVFAEGFNEFYDKYDEDDFYYDNFQSKEKGCSRSGAVL